MNKREAIQVLQRKLEEYRALSYEQLSLRIDQKDHHEVVGESGVRYQIELEFLWDDKPNKNIRVFGMIDDSGWRAWMPLVQCFIRAPDESLIGE